MFHPNTQVWPYWNQLGAAKIVTSKSFCHLIMMTRHEGGLTDNVIAASNVKHGYIIFNSNCSVQLPT